MNSKKSLKLALTILTLLTLLVLTSSFSQASILDTCGSNCVISNNITLTGLNTFYGASFTLLPNASINLSPSQGSVLQINANTINIQGVINANGVNGNNGSAGNFWSEKGGNGGDAGTIILNATVVNVSGEITANGGNGGSGGDYCPAFGLAQSSASGGDGGAGGSLIVYYSNLSFEGNLSLNGGLGGKAGLNHTCYLSHSRNGSNGKNGVFEEHQVFQTLSTVNPQTSTIQSGQTENLSVSEGSGFWSSSNSTIARITSQNLTSAVVEGWFKGTTVITITSGGESIAELPLSLNWTNPLNQYEFGSLTFSIENINSTSISILTNPTFQSNLIILNINDNISLQRVNITLEKIVNEVAYIILTTENPQQNQTAIVNVIPGSLSQIIITPNPAIIQVNSTQQFNATSVDIAGNILQENNFNWNVTNNLGVVNQNGLFTAGFKAGSTQVTASIGNVTGTASITINPGPPNSLLIQPYNPAVQSYSTIQFNSTILDAYDNLINAVPNWTATGNCNNTNNSVTVQASGQCTVTASFQNVSNQSIITIVNQTFYIQGPSNITAGNTSQYQAVYCNETCSAVNASWSGASSNGTFTSTQTGTYTIYAYYNGSTANFTVTVTPATPSYILIPQYVLTAGVPQQLYAYVYDTLGNQVLNATVNFITTPINGTAVIINGYIFGEKAGQIQIQAFACGLNATSISTVYPGTAVSLQIKPFNPSVKLYSSLTLNAVATDSFGNQFNVTANWNSPLPVNNNTLYASQPGVFKITAFYSNLSASTNINVYQPLNLIEGASGQLMNGIIKPNSNQIITRQPQNPSNTSNISGFFTALTSFSTLPYLAVLILVIAILFYKTRDQLSHSNT